MDRAKIIDVPILPREYCVPVIRGDVYLEKPYGLRIVLRVNEPNNEQVFSVAMYISKDDFAQTHDVRALCDVIADTLYQRWNHRTLEMEKKQIEHLDG